MNVDYSRLQIAASASSDLLITSPFIKAPVLAQLLNGLKGRKITVVTRWRLNELSSGISDLDCFEIVTNAGGDFRLLNRLHGKYYRFGKRTFFGSANLTRMGMGLCPNPNLEILVENDFPIPAFEEAVLSESTLLTASDVHYYTAALANYQRELLKAESPGKVLVDAQESFSEESPLNETLEKWYPHCRIPESLYRYLRYNRSSFASSLTRHAEVDMAYLNLSECPYSLETFRLELACILKSDPVFRAVTEPIPKTGARFGLMRSHISDLYNISRTGATYIWQTWFRWILFTFPEEFTFDRPRHSEIIYRT